MKKKILFFVLFLFSLALSAQTNKALEFSGGNNYVNVSHFPVPETLTIEAWIRTTHTGTGSIVTWKEAVNNRDAVMFRIGNNGRLVYGEWIGGKYGEYQTTVTVNTGSWVHVAVVRGESSIRMYINGVESYVSTSTNFVNGKSTTTALSVGAIQVNASGGVNTSESFVGRIDEVRIWSSMLSAAEINQNMKNSVSPQSRGLQAYFNFDDQVQDLTSNAYQGTIRGSVPYVNSEIFNPSSISELSFTEASGNMPSIQVRVNNSGILYWGIRTKGSDIPSEEALLNGQGFAASGSANYLKAEVSQVVPVNNTPSEPGEYVVYAVLKQGSNVSSVFSFSFNYIAAQQLPQNWFNTDVGQVGKKGFTTFDGTTFTVNGSGGDIWGSKDAFQYVCTTRNGNTELIARINTTEGTNSSAKSGIMIRSSLEEAGAFAMIGVTPTGGIYFAYRPENGWGVKQQFSNKNVNAPQWLRLVYKDGYALAYFSEDGSYWNRVKYPIRLASSGDYYAGMVYCSKNNNVTGASTFSNVTVAEPAHSIVTNEKGEYFSKKSYEGGPLPTFESEKGNLPAPVLDGNQNWIDLYWGTWDLAFDHMKQPIAGSNYVSNHYDDAFNSDIFQWDILFMTLFGKYANHIFPSAQSLDNFYANQHRDGLIVRQISSKGDDVIIGDSSLINPPLLSWAEMENYRFSADKQRLAKVLPVLEKYFEYLEGYHRGKDTDHQLYWTHGYASGMDNTPRDNGRPNGHMSFDHQGWVDLSSQMVIQCNNIAAMCKELSLPAKEQFYTNRATEIGQRINQYMWNETDGLYYDVNVKSEQTNHKTIACFWPMLANITSSEQNERLVANLKDPKTFWRDMIFPSLSADHPEYKTNGGYWLGGVWPPTNYAVIKGLSSQGYNAFAREASERFMDGMYEVYINTNTLWENYAPEKKNGVFMQGVSGGNTENFCRKDFVGWTGLGPIALLIEEVIGIKADGVKEEVVWDLSRLDRNGIENIRFGDIVADLVCQEREKDSDDAHITVTTNKAFKLIIRKGGKAYEWNVEAGESKLVCTSTPTSNTIISHKESPSFKISMPNNQKLHVEAIGQMRYDIRVFDTLGRLRLVALANQGSSVVNAESLLAGSYVVTIESAESKIAHKIAIK